MEFVAKNVATDEVSVGDAMSYQLVTINEDAGLFETVELMRARGVRRVPVVDTEGALVGLVASDDALELLSEQLSDLVALVASQLHREAGHLD
jgi:CBS domain-containing protein